MCSPGHGQETDPSKLWAGKIYSSSDSWYMLGITKTNMELKSKYCVPITTLRDYLAKCVEIKEQGLV